ncbi:choice-of-anchor tandem repeat GloVer-containing protein [Chryseolinea soli]|uniref:T9SS C-terminal target domain-containing protein n=1 Tax=Chryseolinea soli TaxID=2321403 RepID=A0A385SV09_9BACT|nr:choice-of-anchor tandem repeat GloVer-containing protein [Chryseolinea soli]AYB35049.1 T9SS C-terminal target domain-containing protein [Chryseolinea soli]
MKKVTLSLTLCLLLVCIVVSHAQHEFYTSSSNTYGVNNNSYAGALIKFDSTFAHGNRLHQFDKVTGGNAKGSVIQATNGKLYGLTFYGGTNDLGVLYEYDPTIDSLEVKQSLNQRPGYSLVQASNGKLYFITGGAGGYLMEYDIATNILTSLKYLPYPEAPKGSLTEVKGKLYGVEAIGGPLSWGRMYEYTLATGAFRYVYNFGVASGNQPQESPVLFPDNGLLYGVNHTVPNGTVGSSGAIYSFNSATSAYVALLNIPDAIGLGAFLTVAPNHKIYGLSFQGGTDASGNHFGSIFEYTPATNSIRLVHSLGVQADGSLTGSGYTLGGLTLAANGKMYGVSASHIFCFDYLTDKVTAVIQTSLFSELGFDINANGFLKEICRKPSYTYFKNKVVALCAGDPFSYSVQSDNARTYAWKKDGTLLPSQTTSTLLFASVTPADIGTYTCVMTNYCGTTETIGSIQLTVTTPPTPVITATGITTFCEGSSVLLTSTLTGTWSTGETGTALLVTSSGNYSMIYTGTCGPTLSNVIAVTVNPVPFVTTQPIDRSILTGDNASFTVATGASPANYQWQINDGSGFEDLPDGAPYSGAKTPTLNLAGAEVSQNGYTYRCVISQGDCSDTSNAATLYVTTPEIPVITAMGLTTFCEGGSVWLTSTLDGTWNNGKTGKSLLVTEAGSYSITHFAPTGSTVSNSIVVTVNPAPAIVTQPVDRSVVTGDNTSFTITTEASPVGYQWQMDDGSGFVDLSDLAPYSGVMTQTLKVTGAEVAQDGYAYRCVISQGDCSDTSAVASLAVKVPLGVAESPGKKSLELYPNPAAETVYFVLEDRLVVQRLKVKNTLGQVIYDGNSRDPQIPVGGFAKGIYTVEVMTHDDTFVGRFVKD